MQWLLLLSVCLACTAYGINRHLLVPVQDQLMDYYNVGDVEYNFLQSLYSWPNIFTLLLCGIFIDKIGLNQVIFISWSIAMFGAGLVVISAISSVKHYIILSIGRTIVGIGNESLNVAIRVFVVNYVNQNEYGLAMSLIAASMSLSGAINNIMVYQIYVLLDSMQFTLMIPLIICPILSLPLFIIIYRYKDNKINKSSSESSQLITPTIIDTTKTKINRKKTIDFKISALKQLNSMYWVLILIGSLLNLNIQSFVNIRVSFLHHMYGYNYSLSTILTILYNIGAVLFAPLCGIITDKYGIKCRLLLLVVILIGIVHYSFGWIHLNMIITILTLFLLGVCSGIFYPVFFSSIPILVNKNIIGTAYGISASLRFILQGIGYFIVGILTKEVDGDTKYINVQYFEICIAMITFIFVCILFRLDSFNGYHLYRAPNVILDKDNCEEHTEIELDFTMNQKS